MDELVDILTSDGKSTGKTALKSEAHQKGLYHATVHVWFYTDDHKILLQKRASVKKVFPNLWDVSVAGHVAAGEKIENAAIREVKEEIGLTISEADLTKIGLRKDEIVHPNGILDNEFKHLFLCKLTKDLPELTMQIEEVDDIQLFDVSILKDTTKHGRFMVPNFRYYYDFIYDKINAIL
ncbi:Isopentenyl-diphosphate Delta-isomerase [Polaribacter huanghezhanensis]|uniref:NUDIX hydrolase n=1 Tax=Polaribacter huanghezhanensis TaxID=1354726 RepID=UPI0026494199|nr:NUDIX domain-containing protein [Polaribacter huanghezhanensis]WKD86330.1 Isopentenyl-diphosphate Delta-isomerase [Polaribacter huanghezhanensis]